MRNSAVNSHDAKKKLSFVMCVAAHCSLTCINNHINADLNNPYRCVMWNNVVNNHDAKKKDCRLLCAQLHIVRSHELRIALMRNNEINNHDATDRLSFVMYVAAHYSLTCTENCINVVLNNPHGFDVRCITVRSTVMM